MKTLISVGFILLFAVTTSCSLINGGDRCEGAGTLIVTNGSDTTYQQFLIDRINYGSFDPGQKMYIDLFEGYHELQLIESIGDTVGFKEEFLISDCETTSFLFDGKDLLNALY